MIAPEWWAAIWVSLSLALLIILALSAWRLFSKFLTLIDDLGDLVDKSAMLDSVENEHSGLRPTPAVLVEWRVVQARYAAQSEHRADRKLRRRKERISRGKMITSVDATQRTWPDVW